MFRFLSIAIIEAPFQGRHPTENARNNSHPRTPYSKNTSWGSESFLGVFFRAWVFPVYRWVAGRHRKYVEPIKRQNPSAPKAAKGINWRLVVSVAFCLIRCWNRPTVNTSCDFHFSRKNHVTSAQVLAERCTKNSVCFLVIVMCRSRCMGRSTAIFQLTLVLLVM